MNQLIQWLFAPGIFIFLALSVIFSWKARRSGDKRMRGIHGARTNICMGIMLLFISAVQLLLSNEATVRIVIGALFMVVGVFNLFAGPRNLGVYRMMKEKE